jgi:flavin reductase (DIM6/NTAB) family NADH-FMN oxidoreductase RutF
MECRVTDVRPLGSHTMFLAEVVGVTVEDSFLDEGGRFRLNDTGLVMYSHGEYYRMGELLGKFGYSIKK